MKPVRDETTRGTTLVDIAIHSTYKIVILKSALHQVGLFGFHHPKLAVSRLTGYSSFMIEPGYRGNLTCSILSHPALKHKINSDF